MWVTGDAATVTRSATKSTGCDLVGQPAQTRTRTGTISQVLAASLVLEAMTAWTYWREQTQDIPSLYHSIHSKDHFATNVAVAGGLLLLQHDGGGKYTLDSYLKKKD